MLWKSSITVVALVCSVLIDGAAAQPKGAPPTNVVTAKIIEREVVSGQTFVGSVMP